MTILAIIIAIFIGAPILLTIAALLATVPFLILGAIGALLFNFKRSAGSFSAKKKPRDYPPHIRFRLRQSTQPWNRNMRAT